MILLLQRAALRQYNPVWLATRASGDARAIADHVRSWASYPAAARQLRQACGGDLGEGGSDRPVQIWESDLTGILDRARCEVTSW